MNILHINTSDCGGGAEAIAIRLLESSKEQEYGASMVVGARFTANDSIRLVPRRMPESAWYLFWMGAGNLCGPFVGKAKGAGWLRRKFSAMAQPTQWFAHFAGREDFNHPGSWESLELFENRPDIVHCHNLHGSSDLNLMRGGYFDLRVLPRLCREVPLMLTLHDAWLLGGHCAHSFDCVRWRTGCGKCPDIGIYPAISRDASAHNWRRKRDIFNQCRYYVATPSQWLMDKVQQSILAQGIIESRVIPHGVNRAIFKPGERDAAKQRIGLPCKSIVLLSVAIAFKTNPWRDYACLEKALKQLKNLTTEYQIILLALGNTASTELCGNVEIRFIPRLDTPEEMAIYYQAADILIHVAKADTFPTVVIEALSSGLPVVASAVGGIPEQVVHGKTGLLVPTGDAAALARAIQTFANSSELRRQTGDLAVADAASRFDERKMCQAYFEWYEDIYSKRMLSPSAT